VSPGLPILRGLAPRSGDGLVAYSHEARRHWRDEQLERQLFSLILGANSADVSRLLGAQRPRFRLRTAQLEAAVLAALLAGRISDTQ